RGSLDGQAFDKRRSNGTFATEMEPSARSNSVQDRQGRISGHWHADDHAMPPAIFRDIDDAQLRGPGGTSDRDRPTAQPNLSRICRRQAEQNLPQFSAACSNQPRQTQYFTPAKAQSHIANSTRATAQLAKFQNVLAQSDFLFRKNRSDLASDHEADQFRLVYFLHQQRRYRVAVT